MKMLLLSLALLPLGVKAQTVSVANLSLEKEAHHDVRPIGVQVSVRNSKQVPIALSTPDFYLADNHNHAYQALAQKDGVDTSFNMQVNPKSELSQDLWFEIPGDLDYLTLTLCLHAPENKTWDDYLEIPLALPKSATAPMWHDPDPFGVKVHDYGPDLKPPRLVHAVDPELPPGGRRHLADAHGDIVSVVSLIVDQEGNPRQVRIEKAAGMGFDAQALLAVRKYRFKPAVDHSGNPVMVKAMVRVNFHLY
jgi:TonB family protein